MIRMTLLVLSVLLVGASGASAQMVTVLGFGNKSCGSWTEAARITLRRIFLKAGLLAICPASIRSLRQILRSASIS
jgi:hypothetical protein